jgi:hypothetical protein
VITICPADSARRPAAHGPISSTRPRVPRSLLLAPTDTLASCPVLLFFVDLSVGCHSLPTRLIGSVHENTAPIDCSATLLCSSRLRLSLDAEDLPAWELLVHARHDERGSAQHGTLLPLLAGRAALPARYTPSPVVANAPPSALGLIRGEREPTARAFLGAAKRTRTGAACNYLPGSVASAQLHSTQLPRFASQSRLHASPALPPLCSVSVLVLLAPHVCADDLLVFVEGRHADKPSSRRLTSVKASPLREPRSPTALLPSTAFAATSPRLLGTVSVRCNNKTKNTLTRLEQLGIVGAHYTSDAATLQTKPSELHTSAVPPQNQLERDPIVFFCRKTINRTPLCRPHRGQPFRAWPLCLHCGS